MKAANLLINNEGQLMIADFGLARSIHKAEQNEVRLELYSDATFSDQVSTPRHTRVASSRVGTDHPSYSLARSDTTRRSTCGVSRTYHRCCCQSSASYSLPRRRCRCVMAEMYHRSPIFPGQSDLDQACKIFA